MASLKDLTNEQKYSVYIFMEEYDKSINGNHYIDPLFFYTRYGVSFNNVKKFRDSIKEDERFSYAISILKEVQNERLFGILLDDCYRMLADMMKFIGSERYTEEYSKLLELFKKEFGYDHAPISECF